MQERTGSGRFRSIFRIEVTMNFIRKYTKTVLVSVLCLTTVFSSAVSAAENPDITPEIRYNMEIQSNSWENWPLGPQV